MPSCIGKIIVDFIKDGHYIVSRKQTNGESLGHGISGTFNKNEYENVAFCLETTPRELVEAIWAFERAAYERKKMKTSLIHIIYGLSVYFLSLAFLLIAQYYGIENILIGVYMGIMSFLIYRIRNN